MCTNLMVKSGRIVDCKQCKECLQIESWRWSQRIKLESMNVKTWFCTFTYRGNIEVGYQEIQKMFKRLRKGNKKKNIPPFEFRYLCVSERGEEGNRLHYHTVIHGELTRRQVEGEWKHGFSNAKLANAKDKSRYISKYMSKAKASSGGKFYKASLGYGTRDIHKALEKNDTVSSILKYFPDSRVVKVNNITVPYKFQFKNDPEQKKHFKQQNALRRDGT